MASDPQRVQQLFLAAVEQGDPTARRALLDQECADDAELRRRVEELLAAHDASGSFLDSPLIQGTGPYRPDPDAEPTPTLGPGTILAGRYKLVEEIGEGGMGAVWMAQQTEPVRRVVAVKVIKAGMDSKSVLARFEAERQALALMDHPNIARVLDAGATPDGRPFFVMELVKGVPITQFCDERKLTPRQRLELFIPVCLAIQHAHQKGVIHRDIKPSNVLVAMYDDRAVPKVIDFGVAKAAGQPLTEKTLMTGFGAVVGTPEYMSPEQANFNNLDIDTRSDVYALGVLLYELLTGTPPFSRKELEKAGVLEILRLIREQEPSRPSTRLSSPDTPASVSAARGTEQGHLAKQVRGEVDWITMKALEKDRARRYGSAADLSADVARYLRDEQVEACPPSWGYRTGKFLRKHKAAFTLAGTAAALLLIGAVVSGCLTWWAIGERDRANQLRIAAEAAEAKEKGAKEKEKFARLDTRRAFYAQSMTLIPLAWEADDTRRVSQLLDGLRPAPGDEDLRGFEWHYWDRQLHQECRSVVVTEVPIASYEQTASDNRDVTLSGDGRRVAFLRDDVVKVVEVATEKELLVLPAAKHFKRALTLNHNGSRLAFVRTDPDEKVTKKAAGFGRSSPPPSKESLDMFAKLGKPINPRVWVEVWDVHGAGKTPLFRQKTQNQ